MLERNQKIIDAIIDKATREYPGILAMVGIYGSFLTGDIHEKSDLDLLILINDPKGYELARTVILEDEGIGHDLYCTTWEALENDAAFRHPHIAKLMDSKIVYCADECHRIRLESLRKQAMEADTRPAAEEALRNAECAFAKTMLAEDLASCRAMAGEMQYHLVAAIALLNKRYFRLGTRRLFQEIDSMERKPHDLQNLVTAMVTAKDLCTLKAASAELLRSVEALFEPQPAKPNVFPGIYEEMFSNWRNKMYLAAEIKDPYLSFDCLCSLDFLLKDLGFHWNIMVSYDADDLWATAHAFDAVLDRFLEEYRKADIQVQRYANVDAFIAEYMKKKA